MQFSDDIKEFLEGGGRCLIIENGEPKFVISAFREYRELIRNGAGNSDRARLAEEINKDIAALAQGFGSPEEHHASVPKGIFYAENDEPRG